MSRRRLSTTTSSDNLYPESILSYNYCPTTRYTAVAVGRAIIHMIPPLRPNPSLLTHSLSSFSSLPPPSNSRLPLESFLCLGDWHCSSSSLTLLRIPSLKSLRLHVAHIHLLRVVSNSPIFCDSSSRKCFLFDASVIMIFMGARLVLPVLYSTCSTYTQNPVFCAAGLLTSTQRTNNDYRRCTIYYGILDSGRKN